jgi:hypothetical protein
MNSRVKNLLFWVVVGLFMILLFNLFSVPTHAPEEDVIFSDFMAQLDKGEITKVIIKANHISAILKDGTRIRTYSADYPDMVKVLRERNVQIEVKPRHLGTVHPVSGTLVLPHAADADRGQQGSVLRQKPGPDADRRTQEDYLLGRGRHR